MPVFEMVHDDVSRETFCSQKILFELHDFVLRFLPIVSF